MSVSNVTGINLARSEFRSLRSFFLLYITLSLLLLMSVIYFYYLFERNSMLSSKRLELQKASTKFIPRLKHLHHNIATTKRYPRQENINSGIFDVENQSIFSTLVSPDIDFEKVIALKEGYIHYIIEPEQYYLGARYIVLEAKDDELWWEKLLENVLLFGSISLIFFILLGWYLGKLFLNPMREALALLDRFIKDTTHELNTPVAAILNNIETLDKEQLEAKVAKKITRIEIAARTISTLYEDLTFLVLHHKIARVNQTIDLSALLHERLEYFAMHLKQKRITVTTHIDPSVSMTLDRQQAMRLFDNLLSNAIKYNKIEGSITLTLNQQGFIIQDTGKGIPPQKLSQIFQRFKRADTVEGGFGIGLNIVAMILEEYHFAIDVSSQLNQGSTFTITW